MPSHQEPIQLSKLLPTDWAALIQDQLQSGQFKGLEENLTQAYAEHGYLAAHAELALRDTDDPTRKVLQIGRASCRERG